MKKPNNANKPGKDIPAIVIDNFSVSGVKQFDNGNVLFNLEINGVKIYGMTVIEGSNGDFLSFPSRKGQDGKYYSIVWCKLSDKDSADIIEQVEVELNK